MSDLVKDALDARSDWSDVTLTRRGRGLPKRSWGTFEAVAPDSTGVVRVPIRVELKDDLISWKRYTVEATVGDLGTLIYGYSYHRYRRFEKALDEYLLLVAKYRLKEEERESRNENVRITEETS